MLFDRGKKDYCPLIIYGVTGKEKRLIKSI